MSSWIYESGVRGHQCEVIGTRCDHLGVSFDRSPFVEKEKDLGKDLEGTANELEENQQNMLSWKSNGENL